MENKHCLVFDNEKDAKKLLWIYQDFIRIKKNSKSKKRELYIDENGNFKDPINCSILHPDGEYEEFNIDKPVDVDFQKPKRSTYVKNKDRIPGQVYRGKRWFPKEINNALRNKQGNVKWTLCGPNGEVIEL